MVEKKFARWKHSSGESEVISATKALFLKSPEGKARLVTSPKEKGTLYDLETNLQVRPVTGRFIKNKRRNAPNYFAYYRGEDSPLKGKEYQIEWSEELQLFMNVFENIHKFQIEEEGQPPIYIIPQKMKMFERIETQFGVVILKFLVEIDYTLPYYRSYFYNQTIGLEFVFSSLPTPQKLVGLSEKGIPVFQAQASLSEWAKKDYGTITDENFEEVKEELIETFQNRNYQLRGKFVNCIQTTTENKEKYEILKSYEEQVEELRYQIKALESQMSLKTESLVTAKGNLQKAQDDIALEKIKLEGYKRENEYYEKLKSDNINLTKNLAEKNTELDIAHNKLVNKNDELKRINSVSWIKRAFKKW